MAWYLLGRTLGPSVKKSEMSSAWPTTQATDTWKGMRMLEKDQIQVVVYRSIDRINELLQDENALTKEDTTILVGDGSTLDSMGFINFVVTLEEELTQVMNHDLNLMETLNADGVGSQRWSTVAELVDLLFETVRTKQL